MNSDPSTTHLPKYLTPVEQWADLALYLNVATGVLFILLGLVILAVVRREGGSWVVAVCSAILLCMIGGYRLIVGYFYMLLAAQGVGGFQETPVSIWWLGLTGLCTVILMIGLWFTRVEPQARQQYVSASARGELRSGVQRIEQNIETKEQSIGQKIDEMHEEIIEHQEEKTEEVKEKVEEETE